MEIFSLETTQPIMAELKRELPRIAKMIGATSSGTIPEQAVIVIDYNWFPQEYMNTAFRDRIIGHEGLLSGLPIIRRRPLQSAGRVGLGVYIYQSRLSPEIKYALYCVRGPAGDEVYMVVEKGNLFKLKRNALSLNKLCNQKLQKPILQEGLLEEVTRNTVGFLLKAKEIERYGVKIKRGIILDGPPGNGKTMLCRYIQKLCSQNSINWGVITSADIDQAYQDKELNYLFNQFTVTFFDDIDISYMDRGKGNGKMACSLLTAMDGMFEGGHLVRIFTTNESVKDLDRAFTRPGRIDRLFTLNIPDSSLRRQLVLTWPKDILDNIHIEECVKRSKDFSFAELEAIRTFLVTNKLLGNGIWSLATAFDEFDERRTENKKIGVGFSADKMESSMGYRPSRHKLQEFFGDESQAPLVPGVIPGT